MARTHSDGRECRGTVVGTLGVGSSYPGTRQSVILCGVAGATQHRSARETSSQSGQPQESYPEAGLTLQWFRSFVRVARRAKQRSGETAIDRTR